MKYEVITCPNNITPEAVDIIRLVAQESYGKALQKADEYIAHAQNPQQVNIATLISSQILALAGYKEIASVILNLLLEKFDTYSAARDLCLRTISKL